MSRWGTEVAVIACHGLTSLLRFRDCLFVFASLFCLRAHWDIRNVRSTCDKWMGERMNDSRSKCSQFFFQEWLSPIFLPTPSFLVGQDGGVYEGVGWNIQGSHTYGYNDIALGIAFIGNFVGKVWAWGRGVRAMKPPVECQGSMAGKATLWCLTTSGVNFSFQELNTGCRSPRSPSRAESFPQIHPPPFPVPSVFITMP